MACDPAPGAERQIGNHVVALWAQHGFVGSRIVRLFVEQRGVQDDP
jgi:hypothetical protein